MLLVAVVLVTLVWLTAEFGPQVIAFTLFSPVSSTIIILICITGVATANWIRDRAEAIRRSSIRSGRCPSCGYPIDAIEPETDGCVVCPECGSAWRTGDPRYTLEGEQIVVVRAEHSPLESR
jgi:ribosomal protein L37AE/L43A